MRKLNEKEKEEARKLTNEIYDIADECDSLIYKLEESLGELGLAITDPLKEAIDRIEENVTTFRNRHHLYQN